jgi:hypothetical protein
MGEFALFLPVGWLDRLVQRGRASVDWATPLGIGPTGLGKLNQLGPRAMRQLVVELCVDLH